MPRAGRNAGSPCDHGTALGEGVEEVAPAPRGERARRGLAPPEDQHAQTERDEAACGCDGPRGSTRHRCSPGRDVQGPGVPHPSTRNRCHGDPVNFSRPDCTAADTSGPRMAQIRFLVSSLTSPAAEVIGAGRVPLPLGSACWRRSSDQDWPSPIVNVRRPAQEGLMLTAAPFAGARDGTRMHGPRAWRCVIAVEARCRRGR